MAPCQVTETTLDAEEEEEDHDLVRIRALFSRLCIFSPRQHRDK